MTANAKLKTYLSEELHYTNYQIKVLRYVILTILSESSKLLIMGLFFFLIGYLKEYLFATTVLLLLRSRTGGMHMKHYATCFLLSFSFIFLGIYILPMIPTTSLMQMILLLPCTAVNYYLAPIVSCYRPVPDGVKIRKSKVQSATIVCLYIILLFIIPQNTCSTAGFWIIILQSIQMVAAKLLQRKEKQNENVNKTYEQKVDVYGV